MVDQSLVSGKLAASFDLAARLGKVGAPLLAAFWEWREEAGQWELQLVPHSDADERNLINFTIDLLREPPFNSIFSLLDVSINARQIGRVRALAAYVRGPESFGRRFDTTFTGGYYFAAVVLVYLSPELIKQHTAA
jgi:hypothetical protein